MEPNYNQELIYSDTNKSIYKLKNSSETIIQKEFLNHTNQEVYTLIKNNPHPNLPTIYTIQDMNSGFRIEEPFYSGPTLDQHQVYEHELYSILIQVASALKHLHSLGIVHRDIKPENIYYTPNGIILDDFDISKKFSVNSSRKDTQALGSIGYASPEHYGFKPSDSRSDIYSMGVLINSLTCGDIPSNRLTQHRLKNVVLKCIKLDPEDRYKDMDELMDAIQHAKLHKTDYTLPGFRRNIRRNKWIASIIYIITLFFIVVVESSEGVTFYDHFKSKVLVAIMLIPLIISCTNYMNIQSYLPKPIRNIPILKEFLIWIIFFISGAILWMIGFGIVDSLL